MSPKTKKKRRRHPYRDGPLVSVTVDVPEGRENAVLSHARRLARRIPPRRDMVLHQLRRQAATLTQRYGVVGLSLFGSVARDRATGQSDVDLLVDFAPGRPDGLFEFVEVKRFLESALGRPVDLTTLAGLRPRIRDRVKKDSIRVF
jgi:predicted nucleotidyltransferase